MNKYLFKFFRYFISIVAVVVLVCSITACLMFGFNKKNYSFVIPLNSGFVFHYDMKDGKFNSHNISDKFGQIVVSSDVKKFVESDKFIYGYRYDLHNNVRYFICEYSVDCSTTRDLSEMDFNNIIKAHNLPLFSNSPSIDLEDFIAEYEKFSKSNPLKLDPNWRYDYIGKAYRAY